MKEDRLPQVATKSAVALQSEVATINKIALSVDCVIFGFSDNRLKVLLIRSDLKKYEGKWTLLGDLIKPAEDIDGAAYRVLKERTGLVDVFLEQVHTFGEVNRHPAGRVVTVAYYSLINIEHHKLKMYANELHWHDVSEVKDLAFDHQEIFETCYHRLQKRMQEHPLGFNLLPKKFSLRELQNLYESVLETKMDRRNFRKKFLGMNLLIDLKEMEKNVPHRPGKLYQFNFKKYQRLKKSGWFINF